MGRQKEMVVTARFAMMKGDKPVIRGQVERVMVTLWAAGQRETFLYEGPYPFQLNNMDAWLSRIVGLKRASFVLAGYAYAKGTPAGILYIVNDGVGAKEGRGCNENKFTYQFNDPGNTRVDIVVVTKPHAQAYQAKVKAGLHIPIPREQVAQQAALKRGEAVNDGDFERVAGEWHILETRFGDERALWPLTLQEFEEAKTAGKIPQEEVYFTNG